MSNEYKDYIIQNLRNQLASQSTRQKREAFAELNHVYEQAAKADEYEAKNKELLEELKYLKKVNDDLVWQRDTDEEHEAKAKAFDEIVEKYEGIMKGVRNRKFKVTSDVTLLGLEAEKVIKKYEIGESE